MLVCKRTYEGEGGGGHDDDMDEAQVGFACVRPSVEPRNAQLHTPDVFTSSCD
jgi:hypothetical protein